jgi:hypothetical protein
MILKATNFLAGLAAIFAVMVGSVVTASAAESPRAPIALTESGLVIGTPTNGVNEFLGIPYAAPPVGALRWTPPKPYGFFPGFVLHATQFGSECTQPGPFGSENCLFLNVYTPQPEFGDGEKEDHGRGDEFPRGLPVMVWIHGGGLVSDGGDLFDPTPLVKEGVIVVTINYRLGYLGFFAQPALDAEGHLAGNYGLLDQQFALKWVQKNIRGFGLPTDSGAFLCQLADYLRYPRSVGLELVAPPRVDLHDDDVSHLTQLCSQIEKFDVKSLVRMFHGSGLLNRWMIAYAAFASVLSRVSPFVAGSRECSKRGSSRAELRIKASSEVT